MATWKAAIRETSLLWKYHSELCSLWTTLLPTVNLPMCISYLLWVTAAATAKLLQSCPTLRPHRWQPTRLCLPWDSPGKNTGVGCHCLLHCVKVKSESKVAQSCPTLSDPRTAAHQAPPSMGFSRQEYWSGLPLPSPPVSNKLPQIQQLETTHVYYLHSFYGSGMQA